LSCFYMPRLTALISSMAIGMSAVSLDGYEPDTVLDSIEKYRRTALFLTPYMTSSLNEAQRTRTRRVNSLQLRVVGGDAFILRFCMSVPECLASHFIPFGA
jgi:acyl-coenzyme A synthetase/AMP-(fatty) acid ligase